MRTLTVYVVTHADEPPLCVFPTMKKANAYLEEIQKEHGECDNWRAEAHTTPDNSAGLADMLNWILTESCDAICAGLAAPQEALRLIKEHGLMLAESEHLRQEAIGLAGIYASGLQSHGLSPKAVIDYVRTSQNDLDVAKIVTELHIATPEVTK